MIYNSENVKIITDQFFAYVKKRFNFLTLDHSYQEAITELDINFGYASVFFIGKSNAIEVIMNLRDEVIECMVSKLEKKGGGKNLYHG